MACSNGSEASRDRRIFRLTVPNLVANLSFPLVGIVDTALVGHLPNVAFMGAVAVASVIFDVVYAGFGFLRMGTTSLASHYHGAGNRRRCAEVLCLAGPARPRSRAGDCPVQKRDRGARVRPGGTVRVRSALGEALLCDPGLRRPARPAELRTDRILQKPGRCRHPDVDDADHHGAERRRGLRVDLR